jgi:hypothetical protein
MTTRRRTALAVAAGLGVFGLASGTFLSVQAQRPQAPERRATAREGAGAGYNRYTLRVNARAFGARGDQSQDDGPAIQRAIDFVAANSKRRTNGQISDPAEVYLPPGWYNLESGPLYLDAEGVSLRGDGATLVQASPCPAIALAIPRAETDNRRIDASYRPGGVALSTRGASGPAYIKFSGGPFDLGRSADGSWDHYGTVDKLTVDLSVSQIAGQPWKAGQYLCGLGLPGNQESPWAVWLDGNDVNTLVFSYKTEGQSRQNEAPFSVRVSLAGVDLTRRLNLVFQLDLAAGKSWAFVNGVRARPVETGERRTPGKRLLCNEGVTPLVIGAATDQEMQGKDPNSVTPLYLFGLSVTAGLKYQDVPVGGRLARADNGQAPDPRYQFDPSDHPGMIDAVFPGQLLGDPRLVRSRYGYGFFRHLDAKMGQKHNRVEGLRLWLKPGSTGIVLGHFLHGMIRDVTNTSGVRGITGFNALSSYPLFIEDCELSGSDTPLYARMTDLVARNLVCDVSGVDSVRVRDASVSFDHLRVWFPGPKQKRIVSFLCGQYGGQFLANDLMIDFEGSTVTDCGLLFEQQAYTPAQIDLRNITFGTVGKVPLVRLRQWSDDEWGVYRRAVFRCENVTSYGDDYTAFVEVNGPSWHGKAWAPYLTRGLVNTDPRNRPSNVEVTVGPPPPRAPAKPDAAPAPPGTRPGA